MLWSGIALLGVPCFSGLEGVAWVSPVFTFCSPRLVAYPSWIESYGEVGHDSYLLYRENTPEIMPRLVPNK